MGFMKKLFYIAITLMLAGCYEEDNELIQSRDSSHRTSEMSRMLKSISAHESGFDDIIDNSSCFSVDFPYQVYINSDLRTISDKNDLSEINPQDNIELVYPVNTTFFNYDFHQAINQTDFNLIKNTCSEDFDIISNECLEIEFPITFKEFNDLTESFETLSFDNNRDLFFYIENLHDNDVYELDYPILVTDDDSNTHSISSNEEFLELFSFWVSICE